MDRLKTTTPQNNTSRSDPKILMKHFPEEKNNVLFPTKIDHTPAWWRTNSVPAADGDTAQIAEIWIVAFDICHLNYNSRRIDSAGLPHTSFGWSIFWPIFWDFTFLSLVFYVTRYYFLFTYNGYLLANLHNRLEHIKINIPPPSKPFRIQREFKVFLCKGWCKYSRLAS